MVRYSEKGSITDTILTDILRTIDELKLFQTYLKMEQSHFNWLMAINLGSQALSYCTLQTQITNGK